MFAQQTITFVYKINWLLRPIEACSILCQLWTKFCVSSKLILVLKGLVLLVLVSV